MKKELVKALLLELVSKEEETAEKANKAPTDLIGQYVLVRAYGHGVSFGILEERYDQYCRLKDARQIFRWEQSEKTGFTLMELATYGVEGGKLSCPSPHAIEIMQTVSIIPVSDAAKAKFLSFPNYEG